jgi:hypothetical protein
MKERNLWPQGLESHASCHTPSLTSLTLGPDGLLTPPQRVANYYCHTVLCLNRIVYDARAQCATTVVGIVTECNVTQQTQRAGTQAPQGRVTGVRPDGSGLSQRLWKLW